MAEAYFIGILKILLFPFGILLAFKIFKNIIFSK